MTLFSTSGFAIIQGIASYWTAAANQQRLILGDIRTHVEALPPGSTLLLDGFCAYSGPSAVFVTNWDASGAVQLLFRDASLTADVITPEVEVGERNISPMHGEQNRYNYDERLWMYNYSTKLLVHMTDYQIARKYFEAYNPQEYHGCAVGREAYGAPTCFYH